MIPSSLNPPQIFRQTDKRNVQEVPFVELADGRLQGVVSSGSDIQRVYVAYFEARSLNFYCSTNNNRPCGGLRGSPCKHLTNLLGEGIKQFGIEGILKYLQSAHDPAQINHLGDFLRIVGHNTNQAHGAIFSRFLGSLQLLEIPLSPMPLPEMDWFAGGL
ncbi:MAG TPA: hypothetical protein DEF47_12095 [Herpetosiphon sp.]|uniref:Uncharacterized protein n=1 Tax=Herpetosiphon aurantiacus (strain ATCC 23779 / DSM 785 / 114-95) TaxID=316274 RepID=A9B2Y3_HERA2|nr:hypothetical protein [Herpetosiphon sp.]ABX06046.1 conserved hypothetical protein [Herpetosiphon aurantiacus DSM 785]HBW50635.1 hypothetical protein [Herpetosiphon sp.]